MQKKIFKQFDRYCYKRYCLALLVLVLAFIFGKNMDVPTVAEPERSRDRVVANQSKYELKRIFSISYGQCGRLFFDLRNFPVKDDSGNFVYKNMKVKIFLSNDLQEKQQELGLYELRADRFLQNQSIELCANSNYENLLFQRDESNKSNPFEISEVAFYPLATEAHSFSGLKSTVRGSTDFSKIIYQSGLDFKEANKAFKFVRKNQTIGQTFIADTDIISGVDLKMELIGTGGIGSYFVELREVDDRDGKLRLSSDAIAYYYFDSKNAEKDLKVEEGIYHMPLAARLEKGKTYFIGISNKAVKFNIINTLKIYGRFNNNSSEKIMFSVNGKTRKKSGELYLKAYGANYVKISDEKVLTGAMIVDNGNGTGLYTYEQHGGFSDYLDLAQSSIIDNKNNYYFYDNVAGGVSGKDIDDNSFIYKVNTIYPFTKMKIKAEQPGKKFINSLIYYSFDNSHWQEIKCDQAKLKDVFIQEDKNRFQELVQGNGKINEIYIKVTYDKNDVANKSIHLFGLKNLIVNAELNLK